MISDIKAQLEEQFLRVNLQQRAAYSSTSIPYIAGWCKGCWEEGILLVDSNVLTESTGPFFIPWNNIAAIQINTVDDATARQIIAEDNFRELLKTDPKINPVLKDI